MPLEHPKVLIGFRPRQPVAPSGVDARGRARPVWMKTVDKFTPGRSVAMGVALSAVNPKNLLLVVGGGQAHRRRHHRSRQLTLPAPRAGVESAVCPPSYFVSSLPARASPRPS